jgi:hypothetical protein
VSKMFGEWYQKTNKTEDTNKLTLLANKVKIFVSSVLFVFWYHSPIVLDTVHICDISRLRVEYLKVLPYDPSRAQWLLYALRDLQFKHSTCVWCGFKHKRLIFLYITLTLV